MNKRLNRLLFLVMLAVVTFGLSTCKKEETIILPTVKVFDGAITIEYSKASVAAEVTDQGGAEVKSRGFVYGLSGGSLDTVFCGSGVGVYSAELNNLQPNTTYVYEAFAKNAGGTGTSGKVSFTTKPLPTYTISVSANPSDGGVVKGGGSFQEGQYCTVIATANDGYTFTNWTENDNEVSTDANYTFMVNGDRTLKANFTAQLPNEYTISLSANPNNGGSVSGGGTYQEGESCTVSATANDGYVFSNWSEDGEEVSSNSNYTFTVNGNRTLVAHFELLPPNSYSINVSADPSNGGSVSGGGTFEEGQSCTVRATANNGYIFSNWTENGNVVSTNANYSFTVNSNRTLVAHFSAIGTSNYTVSVSASPSNGGTVTGGGTYEQGQSCTVRAIANSGYTFANWTENGNEVSTNANYSFTVNSNRNLVAHFTTQGANTYTINVSANPSNGGTVAGGGTYEQGQSCTVHATANGGYTFTNWTENGNEVSTNANYTFTVNGNRTLVANFIVQYTISISANPTNGGSVTGGGIYTEGQSCTVSATPNTNHAFTNWTENGTVISTNANYTFIVTTNRNMVANFTQQPQAPTGAINGRFSVSATRQVWFSQGNLQYNASSNTWRFAENQWNYVGGTRPYGGGSQNGNVNGSNNSYISPNYGGWIDLFGWGTSGYNHGAICYQPWSTSLANNEYYAYGQYYYNLNQQTGQADWGYNTISNGGNTIHSWRTMTNQEWQYVFDIRVTTSGIRYVKAIVHYVRGIILLPDNWDASYYELYNTNDFGASYSSNQIDLETWVNSLESHGAVFLPDAGCRRGTEYDDSDSGYWSTAYYLTTSAYVMSITSGPNSPVSRFRGQSVRLVRNVQ